MFYAIENKTIKEVGLEDITPDTVNFAYLDSSQLDGWAEALGISSAALCEYSADTSHFRTSIDMYEDYSIALINVIDANSPMDKRDMIALIITKNQFLVVKIKDDDNSTMNALLASAKRFAQNATLEKVMFGTLDILLADGNKSLEIYERSIMAMEENVVSGKYDEKLNEAIFEMRTSLSVLRNYYEQLVDIGEGLQENENDLFPEEELRYFKIFTDKAQRLSDNTQVLSENLIHLREALEAALNYSMNGTMKVFTVVSVIFLPLTLITGWYGMNFSNMPELYMKWGYPAVIALSVVVLVGCLVWFKKKRLL